MRVWTKAAALNALRREARRIGKTPGAKDLWKDGRTCPTYKVYRRLFGSLKTAQALAGLPLNRLGRVRGWRKAVCHRGHRRTPDNRGPQGHCLQCAKSWGKPRRLRPMVELVPLSPEAAAQITEAKKAHWSSVERREAGPGGWVHPYRRSA